MRVWVTGASGFVGRRVLARLAAEGATALASDRELDVAEPGALAEAARRLRPDAVVHLAAVAHVPDAAADPLHAFRVNTLGTRNLLAAVAAHAPRARVLLVGSSAVYGTAQPGDPPFDEGAPLRPRGSYGWTKAAADLIAAGFGRAGLAVVRLRPFNHTGPGRPSSYVEASFARQLAEIEAGLRPPRLAVGNLDAVRDFLHVDDVVDAYWRLLQPGAPCGVFNVASGQGTAVRDVLAHLTRAAGIAPELEVERARWRPTDVSVGDARRLRRATGWAPARTLGATLDALLEDWRQRVRETPPPPGASAPAEP